ncbi:right-handed parallel beta-helix repeat-containing protein [Myxococcota bacterium]
MTSPKLSILQISAFTRGTLCVLAAAFVGCNGPSSEGESADPGGDAAAVGGAANGSTVGAGGATASQAGPPGRGGNTSFSGGVASVGVRAVGGSVTGAGGRIAADADEATTTAAGRATTTAAERTTTTAAEQATTTAAGGAATGESRAATGESRAATGESRAATGAGGATSGAGGTTGEGGNTSIDPDALFVAPDGTEGAAGTIDDPMTLNQAVGRVNPGQTIYLRGGTYPSDSTIRLGTSGSNGSLINLRAYPLDSERPLFDFAAMSENSSNRGFILSGSHWHIYGIDVYKAGDNCMFVSGSNNTLEYSTFFECADTGLQLGGGAANNLILNCDSYFNADSSLENADGFAAKLDVGTGNKFVGCRAWNNLDDGWDGYLRPANDVTTTYENCWAMDNGRLKDGTVGAGDGNGFKTGGSDDKALRHNAIYQSCISTGNVNDGFDHNSNRGSVTILNCAAHNNGSNINFGTSNIAASLTIKNTISLGNNGGLNATSTDITNNSWQNSLSATNDDFVSVDAALLKSSRKSDGSLPDIEYLKLVPASDLRNAGVDVGLSYSGSAPDIGPFESDE